MEEQIAQDSTPIFQRIKDYLLGEIAAGRWKEGDVVPSEQALVRQFGVSRMTVNRAVRDRLGTRKASFAPSESTREITGMEIGGVTVFGLPRDLPIWVDARVMARPRIVVGGGSRSWKVLLAPSALASLPGVEVVEGLATDPPSAA